MNAAPTVRLEGDLSLGSETLDVRLRIMNAGRDRTFVRLVATNGLQDPIPDWSYVCYREDWDALHLFTGQPPSLDEVDVYAPAIALARGLDSGETVEHEFQFPLPVGEWNPHDFPPAEEEDLEQETSVRRVVISVQWVLERDIISYHGRDDYPPGFYRVVGSPVEVARTELMSEAPIPVLFKDRPFPRF